MIAIASEEFIRDNFFFIYSIVPSQFFEERLGWRFLELGLEISFVMKKGRLLVFRTWQ